MSKPGEAVDPRFEAEVQDLLARVLLTKLPASRVEREAGLPAAFLCKGRKGKNRDPKAADSWAKLRRWLVGRGFIKVEEPKAPAKGSKGSKRPAESPAKAVEAIARAFGRSDDSDATGGLADLENDPFAKLILAIRTFRQLRRVTQQLAALGAAGFIKPAKLDATLGCLKELKVSMKLEREERAREAVAAIEILTTEEEELLRQHREKVAGPPVEPGARIPPPEVVAGADEAATA